MLQTILGIALGFVCGYLFGSERARDEASRRFASAQEPMRQATDAMRQASERISGTLAGGPDAVKQAATRASAAVQTTAERATHTASTQHPDVPNPSEVANRLRDSLPSDERDAPPA